MTRSDFFHGIFTPNVLAAYRHSRNKSTEKGEGIPEVGGLSLRVLSGEDSDGGRGWWAKCATRSTVWEGMVVEKRRQVVATRSSYPKKSTPDRTVELQGRRERLYETSAVEI